ncbi:NADH-cytochrome b5 reductase 1 [Balamuthia mandrillaris]
MEDAADPTTSALSTPTVLGLAVGALIAFVVGRIVLKEISGASTKSAYPTNKTTKKVALDPERYQKFALAEKIIINHNTRIFRFSLPKPDDVLGLPIGQHMSFRCIIDGKEVYRPYTPISSDDDLGYFDLLIKVYPKGQMSSYFDRMEVGDVIDVKGPKGKFIYRPNMKRAFGMLAGGTGITPMLQVINAILKNPKDRTQLHLIFANVTEEDILLRDRLEHLAEEHPDRFKLFYALNQPPEGWTQGVGFVTAEMIKEHCPAPADDIMMVMCGPTPMNNAMLANLQQLGYSQDMCFKF